MNNSKWRYIFTYNYDIKWLNILDRALLIALISIFVICLMFHKVKLHTMSYTIVFIFFIRVVILNIYNFYKKLK